MPAYNEPIWPVLFDTFEGLVPLIVTDEMLEVFVVECADIVFPWEPNSIVFPRGERGLTISPERQEIEIAAVADEVGLPAGVDTVEIRKAG